MTTSKQAYLAMNNVNMDPSNKINNYFLADCITCFIEQEFVE